MKKQTSLPIVLSRNEAEISALRQRLEDLFTDVAKMCDLYFKFPFAAPGATPQTIYSNTSGQAETYKSTHLPESMNVAGMELDRGKFARFMTIPGMDEFQSTLDQITAKNGAPLLSYFKIVDQSPEIDEAKFSQYADAHSIMARTEIDRQLYAAWLKMIEGLVSFDQLVKIDFTFMAHMTVPKLAMYLKTDKTGKIVPNPALFQAVAKVLNKKHDDKAVA
jgi:hypothetical protein